MSLAAAGATRQGRLGVVATLGLFGAALLYGDAVITPAITMLSAVEAHKGRDAGIRGPSAADRRGHLDRALRDPA